jgi:hypothetical protein
MAGERGRAVDPLCLRSFGVGKSILLVEMKMW